MDSSDKKGEITTNLFDKNPYGFADWLTSTHIFSIGFHASPALRLFFNKIMLFLATPIEKNLRMKMQQIFKCSHWDIKEKNNDTSFGESLDYIDIGYPSGYHSDHWFMGAGFESRSNPIRLEYMFRSRSWCKLLH